MHSAVRQGMFEVARRLIEYDEDINTCEVYQGALLFDASVSYYFHDSIL